jgi:hypothetical protein
MYILNGVGEKRTSASTQELSHRSNLVGGAL